jgi:hypothetical protein
MGTDLQPFIWVPEDMHFCENCQFFPKKPTRNGLCLAGEIHLPEILTRCYSFKDLQSKEQEKPFWE